uniref:Uncharacterized protein n=1 Tax=Setaria italica TaxID=4555 RepID=K3Y4B9_SETIT
MVYLSSLKLATYYTEVKIVDVGRVQFAKRGKE